MDNPVTSSAVRIDKAGHLVETDWLAREIASGNPRLRIVDMRGSVRTTSTEPGVQSAEYLGARNEYLQGHIPGAVYLDWTRDIVDETDPVPAQAAGASKLKAVLEGMGIGDEHLIVAYDAHPASQFATRLWWLLRYYSHTSVRILNGGWPKWLREQKPVSTDVPQYPPSQFTPLPVPEWRSTAEEVARLLGTPDVTLVDARDADQYSGRVRRGPRGGHIPGAIHLPREAIIADNGTFKKPAELARVFQDHGVRTDSRIVAYCNGGVAATSVLFSLSMLGWDRLTNYDGSWNEWTERADLPVEM